MVDFFCQVNLPSGPLVQTNTLLSNVGTCLLLALHGLPARFTVFAKLLLPTELLFAEAVDEFLTLLLFTCVLPFEDLGAVERD